jgi:hypothetical protein
LRLASVHLRWSGPRAPLEDQDVAHALADPRVVTPCCNCQDVGTGTPHGPAGEVTSLRLKMEHAQILKVRRCSACRGEARLALRMEERPEVRDQVKIRETADPPRGSVTRKRIDKEA